jgi:alkylhydroperoxidase family enzyme
MRLPYAPSTPPPDADPSTTEIYARIAARRHPRPLIPLDLSLLHSPPVADGWNSFLGAIRTRTILPGALLELSVCRVAVLNGAVYEWNAHAPLALKDGVSADELRAVREVEATITDTGKEALGRSVLSEVQRAVVRYTDEMTLRVRVEEETFEDLRRVGLNEREIVELTTGVAAYNCVSRVLVALDVGENNGREMKNVEELVSSLST